MQNNGGRIGRNGSKKIRVALIGVGNCASSLVQGVEFYKHAPAGQTVPGLIHVNLGGFMKSLPQQFTANEARELVEAFIRNEPTQHDRSHQAVERTEQHFKMDPQWHFTPELGICQAGRVSGRRVHPADLQQPDGALPGNGGAAG